MLATLGEASNGKKELSLKKKRPCAAQPSPVPVVGLPHSMPCARPGVPAPQCPVPRLDVPRFDGCRRPVVRSSVPVAPRPSPKDPRARLPVMTVGGVAPGRDGDVSVGALAWKSSVGRSDLDAGLVHSLDSLSSAVSYLGTSKADKFDTYTKGEVDEAARTLRNYVDALVDGRFSVVESLPETGSGSAIYLVPRSPGEEGNVYDEYVWANGAWEKVGSTEVDLSGYVQDTRTVNGHPLSSDVVLSPQDIGAATAAQGAKADAALSRSEVEAGWWSEWVVRDHGSVIANAEIVYFPSTGYWEASVDGDFVSGLYGSADETYLEFPDSGRYVLTATRHRVAAPVPAKTSDLVNDSGFATVSQIPQVPTNVSAFENDAGYVTEDELTEAVAGAIDDAGSMDDAKADKRIPAATGNLASLAADGNLMDSGKQPSDFAPSSNIQKSALASDVQASLSLADSALQVPQELVYEDGAWTTVSLGDGVELVDGPRYDAEHYPDFPWSANFSIYGTSSTLQLSGPEDATELKFGPNGSIAVFSRVPAGYVLREATRSRSRSAAEPAKVQPAGFYADRSEMSVTPGTGEDADKATIQLKDGLSATVLTQHQDISGKADASTVYTKSEIDDMFDDLTYTPISISSFTVSPSSVENGSTVSSVTFSYTLSKAAESAALDGVNVALSGKTGTFGLVNLSLESKKTWTLSVTDRGSASESPHSASRSATLDFYWKRHWGVAAEATPDAAFILGLASGELASSRGKTFTVTAGSGQYIWYAYPKSWGAAGFKVGGFDGGFQLVGTVNHVNASGAKAEYYVYRSDNPSLGATTVVVS